jgi:transcription elongation factor Elf1
MAEPVELELYCPGCRIAEPCLLPTMSARLRAVGKLRREAQPARQLVRELFRQSADRFACASCGHVGLVVRAASQENWPEARRCEECGQPIASERIEALPHVTRCARCENQTERTTGSASEREFCPRCGEVLVLRLSRDTGISRYTQSCPRCKTGGRGSGSAATR